MGCVGGQRLLPWYLALVCLAGALGRADAQCDATCIKECRTSFAACQAPLMKLRNATSSACTLPGLQVCSNYTQITKCLDGLSQNCLLHANLKSDIDGHKSDATTACSKRSNCLNTFMKCPCKVLGTQHFDVGRFCDQIHSYVECESFLPADCWEFIPSDMKKSYSKVALGVNQYIYCPSVGGCGHAPMCLHGLQLGPPSLPGLSTKPGLPNVPNLLTLLVVNNVCRNSSAAVFDCLNRTTSACRLYQGNTSMDQIKTSVTELCKVGFQAASGISGQCDQVNDCVEAYLPTFLKNRTLTQDQTIINGYYVASAYRSGFWCSWMKHSYQCLLNNTNVCNLTSTEIVKTKLKALEVTCEGAANASMPFWNIKLGPAQVGDATSVQPTVSRLILIAFFLAVVL